MLQNFSDRPIHFSINNIFHLNTKQNNNKILYYFRHVSSHEPDVLSSKEGTSVSETSKDGLMSEDPESAEESEKTQTTSDADSPGGSRKNSVKGTVLE